MTGVLILGAGARTPLGRNRQTSAAAVRCGIAAIDDYPDLLDRFGMPFKVARDTGIDQGLTGVARLVALALPAVAEALAPLAGLSGVPPVTLLVSTGEVRPGQSDTTAQAVAEAVQAAVRARVPLARVLHQMAGHAGGTGLVDAGARMVAEGKAELVLAGGVDSYLNAETLNWLDEGEQLHSEGNIYGFCPGEAAGFVLIASAAMARRLGLPALTGVVATASSVEANLLKTTDICLGEGLGQAFGIVAQALGEGHAASRVICDMNGERYRGDEYGFAVLRAPRLFHNAGVFETPADCWGDVGAASGPLYICLAIEAEARGYASGPLTLIWGSSEHGQRSAALLAQVRRG